MGKVHSEVKRRILDVQEKAYVEGINMQVSSGFRSFAEQDDLYAKGRSVGGSKVTNARAGQSIHNYGYAIDFFLTNWDGSKALWNVNDDWRRVAELAKSVGFSWGGDWTSFKDYPHLDLSCGLSWQDFANGKRPNLDVSVHESKDFLENGDGGKEVTRLQEDLIDLGYDLSEFGVDGDYGDETEKAVRAFQVDYKLVVDGVCGSETDREVDKALKGHYPPKSDEGDVEGVFRIYTGVFADVKDISGAFDRLSEEYSGWTIYVKADKEGVNPSLRLVTGTFKSKKEVVYYTCAIKNLFGWTVNYKEDK
ncbi:MULTISPECIES: M15 family metallopeptidase [Pontibacillus]|uniref:M15 family metallopeptidase n=1 Tax=Pontibacillus chungwhensis TaxID=265426 RepID=A0ABY8V5K3_9BACI|nr:MULTISPECIES: M15 family metallopeptidase [Pontibacillus]MCD5326150.1 M15 family metallopeptidase [Pontibacillus sp. HN14]WIG00292.1 M15 family metallopeptidase [Pontibacillus chungwhensis]